MPFNGIANSAQLTILTKALNDHCLAFHISDESDRDMIARLVMSLFSSGVTSAEELKAGLSGRHVHYERRHA